MATPMRAQLASSTSKPESLIACAAEAKPNHLGDEPDAAAAVDDAVPGRRDGAAERGNDA